VSSIVISPKYPTITLAQLCIAVGSGQLRPTISGDDYIFKESEITRIRQLADSTRPTSGSVALVQLDYAARVPESGKGDNSSAAAS
jgi:hypothetical protein